MSPKTSGSPVMGFEIGSNPCTTRDLVPRGAGLAEHTEARPRSRMTERPITATVLSPPCSFGTRSREAVGAKAGPSKAAK